MRKIVSVVVLVLAGALRLAAQGTPPVAESYHELRVSLRNVMIAEEKFYSDHGTYTSDLAALGVPMPHTRAEAQSMQVGLVIVQAAGRGWWGQVWSRTDRQHGCVVSVGDTKYFTTVPATVGGTAIKPDDDDGRIVCDQT